jgi:uncharacterized membrane protein YjjP (DUF1212 family)
VDDEPRRSLTPPHPRVLAAAAEPDAAAAGFLLELVRALHSYGESAQRVEEVITAIADRLGMRGAYFFSTPTSIMASFGPVGRQRTHMLRVRPGEVDLGKLSQVEQVSVDVALGRLSPEAGTEAIARISAAPPIYGPVLTTAACAVVSGTAGQFLGGGVHEVLVATILGLGLGLMALLVGLQPRLGGVLEPLSAFVLSMAAVAIAHVVSPLSVSTATLAGLIVLVPGFTLTTALSELAQRHLASGTARMSGAFITFLSIAFGVAVGNRVGAALFGAPLDPSMSAALPPWAALVALVIAPLCFMVILRAEPRDAPWIVAAGVLGVEGGRLGAATLGIELGAFAGAFVVAIASSAYERWRKRPNAVVLVPGILLLVPGSVGFRSIAAMLERQALAGIETAFSAILTAVALVAGLLIAGVVAPAPRLREIARR